jgi:hypothetical protein
MRERIERRESWTNGAVAARREVSKNPYKNIDF